MPEADPEPVPIGDLEVADRIARAVRRGGPAERRPTIEQIVVAFGEAEPTPDARRRAARALALAGVATVPELSEAAPGQRVVLEVRRTRRRRALFFGVLALAALIGAAAAVAGTVDFGNDETVADLPAGTTSAPTTTDAPTTSTAVATTTAATTPQPTAAQRRRARRARERRTRERRARERRARARRRVSVRLNATAPTFLCVDGDGRRLFDGTLSGSRTFRAREVRMNVGLGPSTHVTANGQAVPLTASPTGVAITPRGRTFLRLGSRPCA